MFTFLCLKLSTLAELLNPLGATIDFVLDFLPGLVAKDRILALFCSNIATIAMDSLFFSMEQARCLCNIMNIGSSGLYRVNQSGFPVYTDMRLVPKVPCVSLLGLMRLGVSFLLLVLRG